MVGCKSVHQLEILKLPGLLDAVWNQIADWVMLLIVLLKNVHKYAVCASSKTLRGEKQRP